MVFYPNPINAGTDAVSSLGDGVTINVTWFQAEHNVKTNKIAYHIYYSTNKDTVFTEGVKYLSTDGSLSCNLINLDPGQEYFIAVRPLEYDPTIFDLSLLPTAYDNLKIYPNSVLRQDISATDLLIPVLDASEFLSSGIIQVGVELIQYLAVDTVNNNLVVPAAGSGQPIHLIDQGGGHFYNPISGNTGVGTLGTLTTVANSGGPTESWTIRCVGVQRDNANHPIAGTAKFIAIGSISDQKYDGYGNPYFWTVNGGIFSNGVLSFSITETTTFVDGDAFIIKVQGAVVGASSGRGYNHTVARSHTVGGFDGINYWNTEVPMVTPGEDHRWDNIYMCQSRFDYPHFSYTQKDGYHQVLKDLLSTDLSAADADNIDFPAYDYSGYHRTDPVQLLNGVCVGSYIGGEQGCIDGYGNVQFLRGLSLQDINTQRQDTLLSITGRPAVLIRRVQTGITCACYQPSSEYQDDRCPFCHGTKFVVGYEQYFNPRRSDGRILVRPGPTDENLKMYEAGLESEFPLDLWSLTVPTIKTRDVIVLFDQDDNEEFRYEVNTVTRNNTINGLDGGQHFKVFRVRKTDPIYQIRIFRNTANFPSKLALSVGSGPGISPHTHEIVINEHITSLTQINQTTSVINGHNHSIVNGIVQPALGHTHTIILP